MTEPLHCTLAELAPIRHDRAAWNQALIDALARAGTTSLVLDLAGADRIDAGLLASLGPVEQDVLRRGGSLRISVPDVETRQLLRLANLERLLVDASGVCDLSCLVAYTDKEVTITIQRNAGLNQNMATPLSYAWLGHVTTPKVGVDLTEVLHINSVLVAWLLQLGQAAKPATFELRNVNRQVAIQLNQLRLNHLLAIHETA